MPATEVAEFREDRCRYPKAAATLAAMKFSDGCHSDARALLRL
jgi:hypothetical protein